MAKESPQFSLVTVTPIRKRSICPIVLGPFFVQEFKYHYKKVTGKYICRMSEVIIGWKIVCYIDRNGKPPTLNVMKNNNFFPKWRKRRALNELKIFRKNLLKTLSKFNT